MRKVFASLAVLVLAFFVALAGAMPATAAGVVVPTPVNVPANVIKAVLPAAGGIGENVMGSMLGLIYKFKTDPAFLAASTKVLQGAPTAAETAVVAAQVSKTAIPATAMNALTKANVVTGGLTLGVLIGNGTMILAGHDIGADYCQFDGGTGLWSNFVGMTSAESCAASQAELAPAFTPNGDASAGVSATTTLEGVTLSYTGVQGRASNGNWYACLQGGNTTTGAVNSQGGNPYTGAHGFMRLAVFREAQLPGQPSTYPKSTLSDGFRMPITVNPTFQGIVGQVCGSGSYAVGGSVINTGALPAITGIKLYRTDVGTAPATVGQSDQVVTTTANPDRYLKCTVTGSGGVGTGQTANFKESDGFPAPVCPDPLGEFQHIKVEEFGGPAPLVLLDQGVTPEYQQLVDDTPECASGGCALELRQIGTGTCFNATGCDGWFSDPLKTEKYECVYGLAVVALAQCDLYQNTWTPEAKATGNYLSDPATGQAVVDPTATPGSAPGTTTDLPSGASANCFTSGWSANPNPLEWVMVPVKCALAWAFVPKQATVDKFLDDSGSAANGSQIGVVAAMVAGLTTTLVVAEGCTGPPLVIKAFGLDETFYPMDACSEPMSSIASTMQALGTAVIWISGSLAVIRYLASIFGFVPFGGSSSITANGEGGGPPNQHNYTGKAGA